MTNNALTETEYTRILRIAVPTMTQSPVAVRQHRTHAGKREWKPAFVQVGGRARLTPMQTRLIACAMEQAALVAELWTEERCSHV